MTIYFQALDPGMKAVYISRVTGFIKDKIVDTLNMKGTDLESIADPSLVTITPNEPRMIQVPQGTLYAQPKFERTSVVMYLPKGQTQLTIAVSTNHNYNPVIQKTVLTDAIHKLFNEGFPVMESTEKDLVDGFIDSQKAVHCSQF